MAKIISFINYKGGVGKTTTTYHVGCCLAEHGRKTLMALLTYNLLADGQVEEKRCP